MRQRTLSLIWGILLSISSLQAQTPGIWNKAFSEASAKSFAQAHGYESVGFSPAIMSIPDKPFTAKRLYSDKRKENDVDAGAPITAECTIARDTQGRVHYEMAFEGVQGDQLFIKSIDVEIYDPVAHKFMRYYTNADRSLPSEPIATIRNQRLMSEPVKPLPPAPVKQEGSDPLTVADATEPQPGETEQPAPLPLVIFVPVKDNMRIESIDGIIVVGHRTIMKYGPQMQFFHIDETWFSPDFALDMRRTELRETIGTEIVETKDVVEGEPDPSLFRIPPGYIVRRER
jgi:hypothetical protein